MECPQLPRHFIDSAQHVQVVPAESAPQTFASVRPMPVAPRGSSALAIRVRSQLLVSDISSHQKQSSSILLSLCCRTSCTEYCRVLQEQSIDIPSCCALSGTTIMAGATQAVSHSSARLTAALASCR